ncbi:hypothetical protein FSW04_11750 [Baekduia soli]|uniref:Uncharacterized protein n=1 Tax=Baekduia soli TaxID=496014 RepID=A0A5B8U5L4_9ACTN|nr:hypothetical protein [Baekduia soli]QEC48175.1 hypothetical protein FSW04_11750 [Baekduia soli]
MLTTLVWVVEVRFDRAWGAGAHLAYAAVAWAFVATLALLAPMEGPSPRAYQSALYVAAVALALAALGNLASLLGSDGLTSAGTATWVLGLVAAQALVFAVGRTSAVAALLAALAGSAALVALAAWTLHPGAGTFRWVLLGIMAVLTLAAVSQRDRHRRHGVALVDAAGIAALAIALTFLAPPLLLIGGRQAPAGWGWELLIAAAGFGLIAYSSVDRQPGPAYLGVANLVAFTVMTSGGVSRSGATLVGWPIALALIAVVLLVVGLRPTTPAPPPPDADAPEPPPLPLR